MRKKDNQAQPPNLTSSKQFIITSAFKHYERNRIDSVGLANFNSLIHSITLRLLKNNNEPQLIELFRITNDLIVGFLANLSQQTYRHTCNHDDILQILSTITNYFQKAVTAFGIGEVILQSNVISIFWPLFEKHLEGPKSTDQSKVDLINTLIQNIQQPKRDTSCFGHVIKQSFFVGNSRIKKEKFQIKQHFVAFLRQSYGSNNFKQTLLKYITAALSENNEINFKKAIKIYEHVGANCEERRANFQDLLLKSLQYNNCLPFVLAINQVTRLSKIVRSVHLPKVIQRILQKIFVKPNVNINCIKILEDLSLANVSEFKDFNLQKLLGSDNLVLKFLQWLSLRYSKKEQNQASIGSQMLQLKQKMLQQADFKEEKLIQLVRKMNQRASSEINDVERLSQIKTVCGYFGNMIKNLFRHQNFREKIKFKNIDQITFFKNTQKLSNPHITDFILDIFPHLVQDLTFNPKNKSVLKYSIILRKAEMLAEKTANSLTTLKDYFKEVFYQMLQSQSLNYHFVLCYIFLKYQKEKESIREVIVEAILNDLKQQDVNKNVRNLLLSLSLFLKSYDSEFSSQPIKFKIKEVVKNTDTLVSKLEVNNLITVQPKEYTSLKHQSIRFDPKIQEMKRILNNEMYNYEAKQYLNIFYSIVIATNDLIGNKSKQSENLLLAQITSLRKLSVLGQFFTVMHLAKQLIDNISSNYEYAHPSKIEVLLLLLKLKKLAEKSAIKQSEDTDQLYQKLKCYMILINSQLNLDLLTHLDTFRTNQKAYSSQPFQKLIQEQQIIKFYAQVTKDVNFTHVLLNIAAKSLLIKLMELKKVEFTDLPQELQNIFLFYSKPEQLKLYGYTPEQQLSLSTYLMILLLDLKMNQNQSVQNLLKKLSGNIPTILQLFLPKHQRDSFKHLKLTYPVNFFQICVKSVKKALINSQKDDLALFQFIKTIIQEDNKNDSCLQKIIRESLEEQLANSVCDHIFNRTKKGFQLQSKNNYFKNSQMLYKLVGKALEKNKDNLLILVQNIIQLDYYNESEKSAFILKEISYIFTYLQEKSSQICQIIFNYILTLTDIFKGDEKLEISTFICNFFGLQINLNQPINFQNFQKQANLTCTNVPNYKCLKCDEKKIVCFGCAYTCHENHPVCFLNIPIELKFTRCLCCEIGSNSCKLAKENPNKPNIFSAKPPAFISMNRLKPINSSENPPQDFFSRMKVLGGNLMPRHPRDHLYEPPLPSDRLQFQAFLRQQELLEQQIRASHVYDSLRDRQRERQRERERERERDRDRDRERREEREEIFPRMGGRLDRLFERDEFPGGYKMFIQSNEFKKPSKLGVPQEKQKQKSDNPSEVIQQEFVEETYSSQLQKDREQMVVQNEDGNTILKKSVLLPKFIDLMVNFCDKKSDKDKNMANMQMFKLSFTNPQISKILPANVFKLHNNGNFTFDVRKQNQIHNMSCFLVKKNIAQNNKFVLLSSSTQIFVYSKQKMLNCLAEMKTLPGYNSIARHSISFQIHSLDFSPLDKNLFCAAGLHNLTLLNINNDGQITRTNNRYNVSNCYINQIKLGKMGIFIGVDKEIRVLNYSCRHFLTLKAQESNTIIRQWTIFQKAAGCQVLFVCPNGNIFTVDILPSDQGKKQFVARINYHRPNKTEVGASIFGKQLPQIGKYLFASFKDGCHNILGHLEGDQLEDMTPIPLRGLKFDRNIFDTHFIVGHSDLVKIPQQDELYLICTVKKYFPPELSFHQGYLIVIKFKKEGNTEIILINDQVTCEYFQVVKLGKRNFFIYSVHTDGSVQITTFNKINKQIIEEELLSIKQSQDAYNQNQSSEGAKNAEDIVSLRKSIERQIKLENIVQKEDKALHTPFREGSENLKLGADYTLTKQNDAEYEFRMVNFSKIVTGLSLPYFGDIELPTRKLKNVFEVGFTQLQALYFFAQGSFRFKYKKNEDQKYTRQAFFNANNHPRMLDRIQRMQRLSEYHDGDKMFNSHLMNSILGFKEDTNNQLQFVGKTFEVFKAKIPKFEEMFKVQADDQTNSIEKTALIIKMFLTRGIQTGNICTQEQILELVKGIKAIVALSSKRLFNILKDIIVLATKVYQNLTGKTLSINDQNYALRAATQNRVSHYFKMLKLDIGDVQLNDFLGLLCDIIKEDKALMTYYVAKYSGIFVLLHRRLKKSDTQQRANYLIYLYTFAYPILKFCQIPCSWILSSLCSIVYSFVSSKAVRESLYQAIENTKQIVFQNWIKNLGSSEEMVEQIDIVNNVSEPKKQQVKDPMVEIYNMYNRGQIDDETLFKMITDASKLEYERQQENQLVVEENNLQIQPQLEQEMQIQENAVNHNIAFVLDEIDECTDNITQNIDIAYSKIIVLYVISKAIDSFFEQATKHLLKRMKKLVNQLDIKCEGEKLNAVLAFACLFNKILVNSKYLKENGGKSNALYLQLQAEVNNKLSNIRLENVTKIKQPPNLLAKVFRGQKSNFNIHIAYALTCLLLFPCQPSHVLLSLECYWLLPQKREFYSKKKDFSNITDGIQSGNIQKIYEIAKSNPKIWQEYNELSFVQRWIEEKKPNWQLALELMAIYYEE